MFVRKRKLVVIGSAAAAAAVAAVMLPGSTASAAHGEVVLVCKSAQGETARLELGKHALVKVWDKHFAYIEGAKVAGRAGDGSFKASLDINWTNDAGARTKWSSGTRATSSSSPSSIKIPIDAAFRQGASTQERANGITFEMRVTWTKFSPDRYCTARKQILGGDAFRHNR